jgi:hypothetical protein
VAGDFGTLTGLASPCPGSAIFLYAWPHETLCNQPRCCLGVGVRQLVDGLEHFQSKGSWNVGPRIPGRCVAVDGDRGVGVRQLVDGLEHFEPKGSWNVGPRIPSRCVAVDGDSGAGDRLLLEPQGGC